ncbi:transposase [Sedimentibacter hydroxybenzoicus DSM 7310]|uniref:Transposase n=1 Tax=Sedimentibacter hydroxybenzoicus DSM 7310 TaxID=1123245 RepID=A0A974GWM6_SEDHY|nr:transposase [Sedimentibacter hydroxybenzoicus]NYB74649.1 transposase [Sedimentibacter hydroxybenzoicus DSM 7310]
MPRKARIKSNTGIYHIMLRGIDKRNIFLENEDKLKFINDIKKAKEKGNFNVFGYCLMDNHVHLLLQESEEIGTSIKRITVAYAGWHNKKYDRIGHLLQNRYLSEPVNSEQYLLTVLRYIHQNPVKANIVVNAREYKWSSFGEYYLFYNEQKTLIDGDLIQSYFKTFDEFNAYTNESNDDKCLDIKNAKYSDKKMTDMIINLYKISNLPILSMDKKRQIIQEVYKKENTSIRQLARIFGISKTVVDNVIKMDK